MRTCIPCVTKIEVVVTCIEEVADRDIIVVATKIMKDVHVTY